MKNEIKDNNNSAASSQSWGGWFRSLISTGSQGGTPPGPGDILREERDNNIGQQFTLYDSEEEKKFINEFKIVSSDEDESILMVNSPISLSQNHDDSLTEDSLDEFQDKPNEDVVSTLTSSPISLRRNLNNSERVLLDETENLLEPYISTNRQAKTDKVVKPPLTVKTFIPFSLNLESCKEAGSAAKETPLHKYAREGSTGQIKEIFSSIRYLVKSNLIKEIKTDLSEDSLKALEIDRKFIKNSFEELSRTSPSLWQDQERLTITAIKELVNQEDGNGWLPLHFASKSGHTDVVKLLLPFMEEGRVRAPTFDKKAYTALDLAANDEIAKMIIDKGGIDLVTTVNRDGYMPIHSASAQGLVEKVKLLMGYMEKPSVASFTSTADNVTFRSPITALESCTDSKFKMSSKPIGKLGFTALHLAVINNREDVARALLEAPGIRTQILDKKTKDGNEHHAIHLAAKHSFLVELLLEYNSELTLVQDANGNTPLHLASTDYVAGVLMNAEHTFSLKTENNDGNTPLHCALMRDHKEVVARIISEAKKFSSLEKQLYTIKNKAGQIPLHLCRSDECARLLIKNMKLNFIKFENNVDVHGNTPLHYASEKGLFLTVEKLLEFTSSQDKLTKGISKLANKLNGNGYAPLHMALNDKTALKLLPHTKKKIIEAQIIPPEEIYPVPRYRSNNKNEEESPRCITDTDNEKIFSPREDNELDDKPLDIDKQGGETYNLLQLYIKKGFIETVTLLFTFPEVKNWLSQTADNRNTALQLAPNAEMMELVFLHISNAKEALTEKSINEQTSLHKAAKKNMKPFIEKLLIGKTVEPASFSMVNKKGKYPLELTTSRDTALLLFPATNQESLEQMIKKPCTNFNKGVWLVITYLPLNLIRRAVTNNQQHMQEHEIRKILNLQNLKTYLNQELSKLKQETLQFTLPEGYKDIEIVGEKPINYKRDHGYLNHELSKLKQEISVFTLPEKFRDCKITFEMKDENPVNYEYTLDYLQRLYFNEARVLQDLERKEEAFISYLKACKIGRQIQWHGLSEELKEWEITDEKTNILLSIPPEAFKGFKTEDEKSNILLNAFLEDYQDFMRTTKNQVRYEAAASEYLQGLYLREANILYALGSKDKALESYLKLLEIDPDYIETFLISMSKLDAEFVKKILAKIEITDHSITFKQEIKEGATNVKVEKIFTKKFTNSDSNQTILYRLANNEKIEAATALVEVLDFAYTEATVMYAVECENRKVTKLLLDITTERKEQLPKLLMLSTAVAKEDHTMVDLILPYMSTETSDKTIVLRFAKTIEMLQKLVAAIPEPLKIDLLNPASVPFLIKQADERIKESPDKFALYFEKGNVLLVLGEMSQALECYAVGKEKFYAEKKATDTVARLEQESTYSNYYPKTVRELLDKQINNDKCITQVIELQEIANLEVPTQKPQAIAVYLSPEWVSLFITPGSKKSDILVIYYDPLNGKFPSEVGIIISTLAEKQLQPTLVPLKNLQSTAGINSGAHIVNNLVTIAYSLDHSENLTQEILNKRLEVESNKQLCNTYQLMLETGSIYSDLKFKTLLKLIFKDQNVYIASAVQFEDCENLKEITTTALNEVLRKGSDIKAVVIPLHPHKDHWSSLIIKYNHQKQELHAIYYDSTGTPLAFNENVEVLVNCIRECNKKTLITDLWKIHDNLFEDNGSRTIQNTKVIVDADFHEPGDIKLSKEESIKKVHTQILRDNKISVNTIAPAKWKDDPLIGFDRVKKVDLDFCLLKADTLYKNGKKEASLKYYTMAQQIFNLQKAPTVDRLPFETDPAVEIILPEHKFSEAESGNKNFHNPYKGYIATLFDSMKGGNFPETISFLSTAELIGKGSFGDLEDS